MNVVPSSVSASRMRCSRVPSESRPMPVFAVQPADEPRVDAGQCVGQPVLRERAGDVGQPPGAAGQSRDVSEVDHARRSKSRSRRSASNVGGGSDSASVSASSSLKSRLRGAVAAEHRQLLLQRDDLAARPALRGVRPAADPLVEVEEHRHHLADVLPVAGVVRLHDEQPAGRAGRDARSARNSGVTSRRWTFAGS